MTYPFRLILLILLSLCGPGHMFAQERPSGTAVVKPESLSTQYTIKLLDPTFNHYLNPKDLNNSGEVIGDTAEPQYSFLYKDGELQYLQISAEGINDAGDIVGGRTLYKNGSRQYLDFSNLPQGAGFANGINNSDQISGYGYVKDSSYTFLYENGKANFLPLLPGGQHGSLPTGINDAGEITGYNSEIRGNSELGSFFYTHGFMVDLEYPGAYRTLAAGLDNSGRVTGYIIRQDSSYAAFIYSGGAFTLIPYPQNVTFAYAQGINDCGDVVGSDSLGGFLYTGGVVENLNELFKNRPYNFLPKSINNQGEISGALSTIPESSAVLIPKVSKACGMDATIVNTPSSSTVGPGGEVVYTIIAKNVNTPTKHFTVSDVLGRESRLLRCGVSGSTGTCSTAADGRSVSVDLPDLAKGSMATIMVAVHIAGTSGDDQLVMDTAKLSSNATADYLSTAYTNIKLTADLSITAKLVSDESGLLHYQATVTDAGPNNSHAALLLDPLPANTSFVSASTNYGTCSFHPTIGPNGAVRCPLGNLAHLVPAKIDVVLQASPAACPSVTNTFSLTSKSIDSDSSNDSSTVVTPLSGSECISGMAKR